MDTTAPERSLQQRMDALAEGNRRRTLRAQMKRDLKAGRLRVQSVLEDVPEWAETMKVFDLLLATPKFGRVKVNRILVTCRISPSKTLVGLTERQRGELLGVLQRWPATGTPALRERPR
jgi:hypothetical protein